MFVLTCPCAHAHTRTCTHIHTLQSCETSVCVGGYFRLGQTKMFLILLSTPLHCDLLTSSVWNSLLRVSCWISPGKSVVGGVWVGRPTTAATCMMFAFTYAFPPWARPDTTSPPLMGYSLQDWPSSVLSTPHIFPRSLGIYVHIFLTDGCH